MSTPRLFDRWMELCTYNTPTRDTPTGDSLPSSGVKDDVFCIVKHQRCENPEVTRKFYWHYLHDGLWWNQVYYCYDPPPIFTLPKGS